jgi:ABC-type nitrate/sulfonate/bicarbonate transport system ATPase subunit
MLDLQLRSKAFRLPRGPARLIISQINFRAEKSELVVLLGPSGIGKSTILRIILGLDLDFNGNVCLQPARLGVMFQEPRLLPWLTVEENVRLVLRDDRTDLDIPALLSGVLLPPVRAALPSALSLGMARRVALARALAVDPQILLLDEPFASLDHSLAASLGALLAERSRRCGTLVLLSTHDIDQALATATRILVIAGQPATLEADVTVPSDPTDIGQLRCNLLTRFPFLRRTGGDVARGDYA